MSHLFMLLFRNYGRSMFILYLCFIQQVKNIGTGTNFLALFCIPPFPHSVEDTLGGGGLSEHPLLIFGLISLIPLIPVTNINNFPTLCPLNFYLICVNIQFAIKYIHTPQVSSLPLNLVLTCKIVYPKSPQQGLSMSHCEAVLGFFLPKFEVASDNFFACQANPKKCWYSFPEESMCPG